MKQVTLAEFDEVVCCADGVYMEPQNIEGGRLEKYFVGSKLIGMFENVMKRVKKEVSYAQVIGCEAMEDKLVKTYWVVK